MKDYPKNETDRDKDKTSEPEMIKHPETEKKIRFISNW